MGKAAMKESAWRGKSLAELSEAEWEDLCDCCGKCCLHKIEDEDTEEILFTAVACRLLDIQRCRCTDYANRRQHVPECLQVREILDHPEWLPQTCAYRLLSAGEELPDWHPLVADRPDEVHRAGISVRSYAVSEGQVDRIEDHVIEWLR